MCRYAREDALGKLGQAVAEGAQLIEELYHMLYAELQQPLLGQIQIQAAVLPVDDTRAAVRSRATTKVG